MEKIIQQKMDQGVVFFIVTPRALPHPPKLTQLKKAAEARKHRALSIKDEHISAFVAAGSGDVVKTPAAETKTVRRAKSAKDAATNQSVGVRPLVGG